MLTFFKIYTLLSYMSSAVLFPFHSPAQLLDRSTYQHRNIYTTDSTELELNVVDLTEFYVQEKKSLK